jgi:DNA-binding CsgD family transcriptional regulator
VTGSFTGGELLELTAGLIEAPQDDVAWATAFAALLRCVPADRAALLCLAPDNERHAVTLVLLEGADESFAKHYQDHYVRTELLLPSGAIEQLRSAQGCLFSEQLIGDAGQRSGELHGGLLEPLGDFSHAILAIRDLDNGAQLHFALLRQRGSAYQHRDRKICDQFLRVARAALRQRRLLQRLEQERAIGVGFAENTGDAVFALDADCGVSYLNAAAHSWLEHEAVISLQAGRLQFRHAKDSAWLRRETAALLPKDARNGGDSLRYRHIQADGHAVRLYAVLSRLPILPPLGLAQSTPRVALYLRCVEEALPQLRQQDLASLFGFTVTESRVVNALLLGITVEQMAQQWGIRSDTVRGHLKRVLAKTSCSRQQELIQVITKALPHLILMNDSHD